VAQQRVLHLTEEAPMRSKPSVQAALKAIPVALAAISLSVDPDSARSTDFTITGDPGTSIEFDTYPLGPAGLEMFANASDASVMLGGVAGLFTLTFNDSAGTATPVGGGLYQQTMTGAGSFTVTDLSYNSLLSGSLGDGTIWATPGSSDATIQFAISQLNGQAATGYLLLQGSTANPVSLVVSNPYCGFLGLSASCTAQPYFDGISLDWTATYEATPYAPASATSAVPEPSTWALMALGFIGLGMAGYRRRAERFRALGRAIRLAEDNSVGAIQ
jgi:hypothetical protein